MNDEIYYLLIILTALMSAFSQILLNLSNRICYNKKIREYLNAYVISAYFLLAVTVLINTYALRFIPLKISHALAASTYFFVLILSAFFLKERITLKKIIGNFLIIVGIVIFIIE